MSEEIDEIWALYADDGGQSLDGVEEALLALKANARDSEAIAALFRAMHTFKGNSRLLGLTAIESCAHLAEDLIGLVRDEGVEFDGEFLALLLEATDVLRAMMEATLSTRRDSDPAVAASISSRMRAKYERSKTGAAETGSEPRQSSAVSLAAADPSESGESAEAVVFEPIDACLADDPLYREIFLELARDCIAEMRQAQNVQDPLQETSHAALADAANRLRVAAEQIAITEWPVVIAQLVSESHLSDSVEAAIKQLSALYERDMTALKGHPSVGTEPVADAFLDFADRLEPLIASLIEAADGLGRGERKSADHILSITNPISEAAELLGYVRLADTAAGFPEATNDKRDFHHLMFELFGDLKLIEELSNNADGSMNAVHRPSVAALGTWCARQGASVINELQFLITPGPEPVDIVALERLLHRVNLACKHDGPDIAGRVAMTLADLTSRIDPLEFYSHPIVGQIQRFITLATPLFASKPAVATDISGMEALLQLLAAASGPDEIVQQVEERLGLPQNLRGCLTASSADTARTALQDGKRFFVVRADLSANDEMAQRFVAWVNAGHATIISSVTVFEGENTVFDFLLASRLEPDALERAIGSIDPDRSALRLELLLQSCMDTGLKAEPADAVTPSPQDTPASLAASSAMLESIGELITGHSGMRQVVLDFEQEDLFALIDAELRDHGGSWSKARQSVRAILQSRQERAADLGQIQTQMTALLDHIQAEALVSRSRSASSLLNSLAEYGETRARARGWTVSIKTTGGNEAVDVGLLQALEEPLRKLVSACLNPALSGVAQSLDAINISLSHYEDSVSVTIKTEGHRPTDATARPSSAAADGMANADFHDLDSIRHLLRMKGGDLRNLQPAGGSPTFRVTMPLATAVLEGMVVRVGEVRYVVPLHSIQRIVHSDTHDLFRVSAGEGRLMLKLSHDDVLPVSRLAGNSIGTIPPADLLLKATAQNDNPPAVPSKHLFVVAGHQSRRVALAVDELIGQQTVLMRPLKGYLTGIRDVTGCALIGSGGVGMVLDIRAILERE